MIIRTQHQVVFAPPTISQGRRWAVAAIVYCSILLFLSACSKQPIAKPENATTNVQAGKHATIEPPLAFKDISVSIVQTIKQLDKLPEKVRVRYRNQSANRGYFELPTALRAKEDFKGLVIAVGMREADGGEPIFVYYDDDAEEQEPKSIAVLDPGASIVVEYPTQKFCMIGHGIAPHPKANLTSCYQAGDVDTEMRLYLIVDLDKMTRAASAPVAIRLSKPDLSMLRDLQEKDDTDRKRKVENP